MSDIFRTDRNRARLRSLVGCLVALFVALALSLAYAPRTGAQAGTAEPGQGFSRTITINSGQVPSSQSEFPLLVSLSNDTDLQAHVARADGGDVVFTNSANTVKYPHEIERYDRSTGTLVAWVRVPSLSDGTVIIMWYGVDMGAPLWNSAQVWDPHFKMVQHMAVDSAAPSPVRDSTANANNGSFQGKSTLSPISGTIGSAIDYPGSAYIDCGSSSSLDFRTDGRYTWDVWVKPAAFQPGGSGIVGKKHNPNIDYQGYELYCAGTGGGGGFQGGAGTTQLRFQTTGGNSCSVASVDTGVVAGAWNHVAVVYDTSEDISIYLNGEPITVIVHPGGTTGASGKVQTSDDAAGAANEDPLFIGWRRSAPAGQDRGFFYGQIDEVELSDTIRSADWIKTEYNNRKSPGDFYAVSQETAAHPRSNATPPDLVFVNGMASLGNAIDISTGETARAVCIGSAEGNAALSISAGTTVRQLSGTVPGQITCRSLAAEAVAPDGSRIILAYELGPSGTTFGSPVTLALKYNQEAVPQGVAASDLRLVFRDGPSGTWSDLAGVTINTSDHTVSGKTERLGQFAMLAPASGPAATSSDEPVSRGSANWLLIGINIAVGVLAIGFVVYRARKKRAS